MSKPNLLAFSSSVGIYRNKRVRDLHHILRKAVPQKVEFADMAPMLFQVVMAYAAENQIDGNFSGYTPEDFCEIFTCNHVHVTPEQATTIIKSFEKVRLFDHDKIRSWAKYNRHLADYEGIIKARARAAKIMHKKREQEAKRELRNGKNLGEKPFENGEETDTEIAPERPSPSKQLWLIEKALETAKGKAKRELLDRKRSLLADSTGVDLSEPPEPSSAHVRPARKSDPEAAERAFLTSATTIAQDNPELLTERMAQALLRAGKRLPRQVAGRFSKLTELAEKETRDNPVPG